MFEFLRSGLLEDFSFAVGALCDSEAEGLRDQRFDPIEEKIVELGTGLAADLDGVFETFGCDQGNAGAFSLEDRIRADGGSVKKSDGRIGSDLLDGFGDSLGRVCWVWRRLSAGVLVRGRSKRSR